jgi:hypothetical protein
MGYWDMTLREINPLPRDDADPVLAVVLRGMIAGLRLGRARLGIEAMAWLNRQLASSEEVWPPMGAKHELDHDALLDTELDLDALARAFHHPSWFIAWNAARLFELYGPAPNQQELLKAVLATGVNHALFLVGSVAETIWGTRAFEILYNRLGERMSDGCEHLYGPMVRVAKSHEQLDLAVPRALDAVAQLDPRLAQAAAEALRILEGRVIAPHAGRIRALLDDWRSRTILCQQCGGLVFGTSCEKCHTVPATPRKDLVHLLSEVGVLSIDELVEFAKDKNLGAHEEARQALVRLAFESPDQILGHIAAGTAPVSVLAEILSEPVEQLKRISVRLAALLHSSVAPVRERIVRSLDAGWLAGSEVSELAQEALVDNAPEVRSAAVELLRRRSQSLS